MLCLVQIGWGQLLKHFSIEIGWNWYLCVGHNHQPKSHGAECMREVRLWKLRQDNTWSWIFQRSYETDRPRVSSCYVVMYHETPMICHVFPNRGSEGVADTNLCRSRRNDLHVSTGRACMTLASESLTAGTHGLSAPSQAAGFWSTNPSTAAVGVFSLEAAFRCTDSVALTQPTLPQNGRRDNLHVVPYAFRDFRWGRALGEMDARVEWNDLQSFKTNALPTPWEYWKKAACSSEVISTIITSISLSFVFSLLSSYPTLTGYHPYPFEEGEIFNAAFWPATGLQGSPAPGSAGNVRYIWRWNKLTNQS